MAPQQRRRLTVVDGRCMQCCHCEVRDAAPWLQQQQLLTLLHSREAFNAGVVSDGRLKFKQGRDRWQQTTLPAAFLRYFNYNK